MANEKNLIPFKKGKDERRNLKGAPTKIPELEILLADVLGKETDGITVAQSILTALSVKAAKGDVRAAELLLNRAYGKPKEFKEHSGVITSNLELVHFKIVRRPKGNE